jgi:hypothetical protein
MSILSPNFCAALHRFAPGGHHHRQARFQLRQGPHIAFGTRERWKYPPPSRHDQSVRTGALTSKPSNTAAWPGFGAILI